MLFRLGTTCKLLIGKVTFKEYTWNIIFPLSTHAHGKVKSNLRHYPTLSEKTDLSFASLLIGKTRKFDIALGFT